MKFNALRDFLAVAERGSLRAAARQLGSAQAAISHSIQELEKELGVVLFERGSQGVTLTPMGQVFLRRATTVFEELRRAREELDQLRGGVGGRLAIAMSAAPHLSIYPGALRPFRQRYPDVRLDVMDAAYPRVEANLLDGSIDIYVGPVPAQTAAGLAVETLFHNVRVVVGRAGHPLAGARSLPELAGAEWLASSVTYKAEEELEPLFKQHGLPPPRIVMRSHSSLTFLSTLTSTDLLMVVPIQWAQTPLFGGKVQLIPVQELLPAPPICVVTRSGMPLTPAGEYFLDMLRREVGHLPH